MSKSCWHTKWKFALSYGVAFDASSHLPMSHGEILKIVCVRSGLTLRMFADKCKSNIGLWWEIVSSAAHARTYCFVYIFDRLPSGERTHTRPTRQLKFIFKNSFQFREYNWNRAWFIPMPLAMRDCVFSGRLSFWRRIFRFMSRASPIIFIIMQSFWFEEMRHVCECGWTNGLFVCSSSSTCCIQVCSSNWNTLPSFTLLSSHHCNYFNAQNLKFHARELFAFFPLFLGTDFISFNFNWPRTDFTDTDNSHAHSTIAEVNSRNWFSFIVEWHICNWKKLYIFAFVFRKYLIENIRASLFCRNQSQLLYTQSCYEFRMENNRITPSNIADMGDDPRQFDHIAFEDDWTNRKVIYISCNGHGRLFTNFFIILFPFNNQNAVLYADTAAIIVLKTNLTHFNETNSFVLDAIILYRVIDETEKSMELQLHAGTIELDTDLLYDPYYSIQFDKAHGECTVLINKFNSILAFGCHTVWLTRWSETENWSLALITSVISGMKCRLLEASIMLLSLTLRHYVDRKVYSVSI